MLTDSEGQESEQDGGIACQRPMALGAEQERLKRLGGDSEGQML